MWRRVEGVKAWRRKKWPLVNPSLPLRRSVWSLPTGWRGIGFYNDTVIWGNNCKVASLVFYNSATIQRAAFRRVGSSVSGMLGLSRLSLLCHREYLPVYCHCHRATLATGTLNMPWLLFPPFDRRMIWVRIWSMGRWGSMKARWNMGSACSTCLKGVKVNSDDLW